MTSRERVLMALNHEEPDRVPLFVGTSGVTTLLGPAYERLKTHLGIQNRPPAWISAADMADTARLKREFGKRLTFCGGIDTHHTLPRGTTDDVRAEVRRRIRDLAPGGGYIAAAVHCIQPDVPPENVMAMCDEVQRFGKYPVATA